jgi:uncharacterized protein YgiB involved in biofilm formation
MSQPTSQSKRSQQINLARMRKSFSVKPLALGIAAIFLAACGEEKQDATIYTNADDCSTANPGMQEQCQTAFANAVAEAERTGPKYDSVNACETDFGANQCHYVRSDSGSFFMPFMAGYMLSNLLSPRGYYSQPMFTSYSPYSPYRNRWVGTDGYDFGDNRQRNVRVNQDAFKPKPTVSKTMSRGGFGSSVRAKSSWGKSSSKSSWGS